VTARPATKIRLCSIDDVADGEAQRFDVDDFRICLVRIGDDFYAIGDRCSHQDFSLAEGEVYPEDLEIECWKHGSTFSLTDGEPQSLPATRPVPVFDTLVEEGSVMVVVR
jgi:3-phenylpropionate/trans-cinnamate dioxygenase ferredoxin subunit